ncbi:MAG: 5'-nucleotidase C-terminal domain-containing protein [Bacteroidales bacterium]|nr:5'-nucleotidase C-terminal domain-containing protein [Bacteroidales bacterium]
MVKILNTVACLLIGSICAFGQQYKISWQKVRMEASADGKAYPCDSIIASRQDALEGLMEILAYATEEITKDAPGHALSNFSADFMIAAGKKICGSSKDMMSILNNGGIRAPFPKGAVRVYEVISTYPFDNKVVVCTVKGSHILDMLEGFAAKGRFEALGGVKIKVADGKLVSAKISGRKIRPEKDYKVVTIDFLLDGGDRFHFKDLSSDINYTDMLVSDVAAQYLRDLNAKGKKLTNKGDSRLIIE